MKYEVVIIARRKNRPSEGGYTAIIGETESYSVAFALVHAIKNMLTIGRCVE